MELIAGSRRLHAQVVEALLRSIVAGDYPPGAALPAEPELSVRFGVSRAVVREAMRVLAGKGLIDVRHGSGTRVRGQRDWNVLDPDVLVALRAQASSGPILRDLLEARAIVECEVAALAAHRAGDEDLVALGRALAAMRDAVDDPPRFVVGDSAFHVALLHAARNRVLERIAEPMHQLLSYAQALTDAIPGVLARAFSEHEAILRALAEHDPAAAREAMRLHLLHPERDLVVLIEQEAL